jgi:hypothetical protein
MTSEQNMENMVDTGMDYGENQQNSSGVTVSFNGNGGTSSIHSDWVPNGTPYFLPSAWRTGFHFIGWFTAPVGGQFIGGDSDRVFFSAPPFTQTLYAQWTLPINSGVITGGGVIAQTSSHGWGSTNPAPRPLTAINRIIVHHTVGNPNATVADLNVEWINRGWSRPGYNFFITGSGAIWQLGLLTQIANGVLPTTDNHSLINIAFAGTFTSVNLPNQAMRNSFRLLCRALLASLQLPNLNDPVNHVLGHNTWGSPTECPGFTRDQYLSWI